MFIFGSQKILKTYNEGKELWENFFEKFSLGIFQKMKKMLKKFGSFFFSSKNFSEL